MATMKSKWKSVREHAKALFKAILPSMLMYFCAGSVLMLFTMDKEALTWDGGKLAWTIACVSIACLYNGFLAFMQGGDGYDMLVTGNVLSRSMDVVEGGYKMSKYKPVKEYRVWKGFASGAYISVFIIFAGLVFGFNQTKIDTDTMGTGVNILFTISILVSGWSVLPFYYLNAGGANISYFVSLPFALLPVIVTGGLYIAGAYYKRGKALRKQAIEERAREEENKKEKKINYGALPGTKPRKRK